MKQQSEDLQHRFAQWLGQPSQHTPAGLQIDGYDHVAFDLDGVLVDSETVIQNALRRWAREEQLPPDEVVRASASRRDVDLVASMAPHLSPGNEAARIADYEIQAMNLLRSIPGAAAFYEAIPAARRSIVTSSARNSALARLEASGIACPRIMVTADDVSQGKPHPQPYRLLLQMLRLAPERCLVFEDSHTGIAAAIAAGCDCIGVGREARGHPGIKGWIEDFRAISFSGAGAGLAGPAPSEVTQMKVSTHGRTPLFDEVRVDGTVLEHYAAEPGDYKDLLAELLRSSKDIRERIGDRRIWHINSTAFGGGVAEMLPPHICLLRELGFDARWLVFKPRQEQFFRFTKGLHNALHNAPQNTSTAGLDELLPCYLAESAQGAAELESIIGPDDFLITHDPQPLCAVSRFLEAHPHPALWRCHIGYPERTATVDGVWRLLGEYLRPFERIILSNGGYAFETDRPIDIVQPSISPFSRKNRSHAGPAGPALAGSITFNGHGEAGAGPALQEMLDSRYFLHVSRWDGLKGIDRLIAAFERFATRTPDDAPDMRLVIAGPDPMAVADDPEGRAYFEKCVALCARLPDAVRRRVYLACISMKDNETNAEIVGRLQQSAHGIFQLSREEGFGLTTTEALFRGKPVVVSSAFGLKAQITDGLNGLVLDEPDIEGKAAEAMHRLATRRGDFDAMAKAARDLCLRSSTQISQIPKWHQSIRAAMTSFEKRHPAGAPPMPGPAIETVPPSAVIGPETRAARLKQSPVCFWLTGLSGAGKSTIANALESHLLQSGKHAYVVDADIERQGLNADLKFSQADRSENVRRLGHLAHSIVDAGLIVIVTAISPYSKDRESVRALFRSRQFFEVHVSTSLKTCIARDTKGLYARAREGRLSQLTGWDAPYEAPQSPDIQIDTAQTSVQEAVQRIWALAPG